MKTYLLISPQPWGKMYLSKHNYAIELAEAGNKVYFLNPPTYKKITGSVPLKIQEERPNLFLIDYTLSQATYVLRFKARTVYDFIIRKGLIQKLNKLARFDELWCFEPNLFSSFKVFNAKKKLLFIVDQHDNASLKKLAREADGIATISKPIMNYFSFADKPKLLLNHGLNKTFIEVAKRSLQAINEKRKEGPVKVAYVGNLLQGNRMDHKTLRLIIEQNSDAEFHIFGPYEEKGNTLTSTYTPELLVFLNFLKTCPHVFLRGILPQEKLALEMQGMDVFLTCYNYLTDINKSSNCHKLIEYLSTGRVIVSNRIIMYENTEGLLEMPAEYTNENLPALFKHVVSNLSVYNAPERQKKRIEFALENTYKKHINSITQFLKNTEPVLH